MRTFSSTVKLGNTAEIWNERTSPIRAIAAGREPVILRPLYRIWPRVGSRKCVSRLKQVVLPAPFGPMSAWMLPRRMDRETFWTATKPLNSFVSPRVSRITSSAKQPPPPAVVQHDNSRAVHYAPGFEVFDVTFGITEPSQDFRRLLTVRRCVEIGNCGLVGKLDRHTKVVPAARVLRHHAARLEVRIFQHLGQCLHRRECNVAAPKPRD